MSNTATSKRPKSKTWEEFVRLYRSYREKPVWGAWTIVPSDSFEMTTAGLLSIRERGERAVKKLEFAIESLRKVYERPTDIGRLRLAATMRQQIVGRACLPVLFEAIVFDRDRYTCRYCRRSVDGVWLEENQKRTIRLVVDHLCPRSKGGERYDLSNCVAACWSCNTLKGPLPEGAFRHELQSIARAVMQGKSNPPR